MDAEPTAERLFTVAFVPGVTLAKWSKVWAERRQDLPLGFAPTAEAEQVSMLHDGTAQVSFVRLPVDSAGLSVIPLYREIPVVVLPKEHELSLQETVTVAELAGEHLLQNPDSVPEWRDVADEIRDGTRRPLPDIRTGDDAAELVAAGVGVVIVPQSVARLHSRKDVVARPVTDAAESQIALAWLEDNTTPDVEEFIGVVRGRTARSSRAPQEEPEKAPPKERKPQQKPKAKPFTPRQGRAPKKLGKGRNRGRGGRS
ncbi:LysR family transcriptional regulator [Mycetocola manganoxydans]|uniref:LysR family transcriptional regulator n=1 Tax=Mycetocola manganoxydans TaxID=699879 RepID=A0A3L6ZUU3_9MICO|nr:LysR substrate-binding domain-containing protein [Mycetocola manganoxydans]RLP71321.1 LysR family transcriptional regulator [Mycetocola manganoxydans]GHD45781.1 LysR family transcriptional regulator [Mycetocola manganoxydans]